MIEAVAEFLKIALWIIPVLGLIVTIHELGHYWAGRWFGAAAESFSFGFGNSLVEVKDRRGTRWRINSLPFGGFVSFVHRDEETGYIHPRHQELIGKPLKDVSKLGRAVIYAAGPMANFILAILLFAVIVLVNGEQVQKVGVGEVAAGGAAEAAGLQVGDIIEEIDGVPLKSIGQLIETVSLASGDTLDFAISRSGELLNISVTPQRREIERLGQVMRVGVIELTPTPVAADIRQHSVVSAVLYGVNETQSRMAQTGRVLGRIVTGKESVGLLSGPVAIGDVSRRVVDSTMSVENVPTSEKLIALFWFFLNFSALVSIGVGFVNLLPLPVLDGGHLVMVAYEAITGSEVPAQVQGAVMMGGFVLIIGLFVVITGGDIIETGLLSGGR